MTTFNGTNGNDTLNGTSRKDLLYGYAGNDLIRGGDGNDMLSSETGNDRLYGQFGSDALWGGDGNDTLYGGKDKDYLYGEGGDDFLLGEDGNDILIGGNGADTLSGNEGNDTLMASTGISPGAFLHEQMRGGEGKDIFALANGLDQFHIYPADPGFGNYDFAVIADFEPGVDSILLSARHQDQGQTLIQTTQPNTPLGSPIAGNHTAVYINNDLVALVPGASIEDVQKGLVFSSNSVIPSN